MCIRSIPGCAVRATLTELTNAQQTTLLKWLRGGSLSQNLAALHAYLATGGSPNANFITVTTSGDQERSLLSWACAGFLKEVEMLLRAGADSNQLNSDGFAPLGLAAEKGRIDMMTLLLSRGALLEGAPRPALHGAARASQLKPAKFLLDRGADLHAVFELDGQVYTAMLYAALEGSLEMLQFLHGNGAPLTIGSIRNRTTALHAAAQRGQTQHVKCLLQQKLLDVNVRNGTGWTALAFAAEHNDAAVVKLLLASGADVMKSRLCADRCWEYTVEFTKTDGTHGSISSEYTDPRMEREHWANTCTAAAHSGHKDAVQAIMTSRTWRALSREARLNAECMLLHYASDLPLCEW